jgi:hypothetical protein
VPTLAFAPALIVAQCIDATVAQQLELAIGTSSQRGPLSETFRQHRAGRIRLARRVVARSTAASLHH